MYFAIATVLVDWWEKRSGNSQGFSPLGELTAFDAEPPRGRREHKTTSAEGDTLGAIDSVIGLPQTHRGHWKAAQSVGLGDELSQVRAAAVTELDELHTEIDDLRARLAAAEARAQAAEANACSGACGAGGGGESQ